MFSFFEKKIFLVDHLHGLVDIHNHILPGIDDGATIVEDSIGLVKGFGEFGITNFVCTPHIMHHYYPNTPNTIKTAFELLKKELAVQGLKDVRLDYAAEHMIDENFENLLEKNLVLPIAKEYLLIEMSYLQPSLNFDLAINKIKSKGYIPVLAHPERYVYLHKQMERYVVYKKTNIRLQLNLLSVSNYYGPEINKVALKLLTSGAYDYLGSDLHNPKHLKKIKEIVVKRKYLDEILKITNNTILTFG